MITIREALSKLAGAIKGPVRTRGKKQPLFGRGSGPQGPKKSGKTRRGASHKQGLVFLGRKIFKMTPAQYRRAHRGRLTQIKDGKKIKLVPNFMKPSPSPKARNVVQK